MISKIAVRMGAAIIVSIAVNTVPSSAYAQKIIKKIPVQAETVTYAGDPVVMAFADDVAQRRGLDAASVRALLGQARKLPRVQQLMRPAPTETAKNWAAYRARFIEPVRLKAGQAFWQRHRTWLDKAQAETGVPASLIVGVIGVETLYGRHTGDFRVLDALTTLAFDFPPEHPRAAARSAFFRDELEQLLSLAQRTGQDAASLRGSYAGAMGLPQFMPSSWVKYAVDFDGDGRVDLQGSPADAIGSVANYFVAFGWKPGMPTHYPVSFDPARLDMDALLAPDILPTFSPASFEAKGAVLSDEGRAHPGPLALIELHNGASGQPPSHVAGTENFYAVTRYNWSSYYALAVIELGLAVEASLRGNPLPASLSESTTRLRP